MSSITEESVDLTSSPQSSQDSQPTARELVQEPPPQPSFSGSGQQPSKKGKGAKIYSYFHKKAPPSATVVEIDNSPHHSCKTTIDQTHDT